MKIGHEGIYYEWYVIFSRSEYRGGIMRFLKKSFSHVYAMRKFGNDWIVVDPYFSHLSVHLVASENCMDPRFYAGKDSTIIKVKAKINQKPRWTFCVFSCVEIVKALLGIRSFWTWTPYQLYKYLKGK